MTKFWDPDANGGQGAEFVGHRKDYLRGDLVIRVRDKDISIAELVERLLKIEDALADYIIFETPKDGNETDR